MESSRADSATLNLLKWSVGVIGLFYVLNGVPMLLTPMLFFNTIGNFPPFNRHYTGDLGSFLLPLGIGLMFIARAPQKQTALVGVVAATGVLHALNHLYDDIIVQPLAVQRFLMETVPLMIFASFGIWVYWKLRQARTV
jgi:hypothetical protein